MTRSLSCCPDDLVLADTPCLQQLAEVYYQTGGNVVAVTEVPPRADQSLRHPEGRHATTAGSSR